MKKTTLRPAIIDDKDILSDFTSRFHDDCCVVRRAGDGSIVEYFVINDCLCYVSYIYNSYRFKVGVVEGSPEKKRHCKRTLRDIARSFGFEDEFHHLKVMEESDYFAFYWEVEEESTEPDPEDEYYHVIPLI